MASFVGPVPIIRSTPAPAPHVTMAQGPTQPWVGDDESEEYACDPRAFLLKKCEKAMANGKVAHNWVLVATHWLPAFTILPNGTRFYRSDKTLEEVQYQGKVGLVIGKGPMAFVDAPEVGQFFHGQNVEIGEWISFDRHDGRQTTINRIHCRYIKDTQILLYQIDNPELVY